MAAFARKLFLDPDTELAGWEEVEDVMDHIFMEGLTGREISPDGHESDDGHLNVDLGEALTHLVSTIQSASIAQGEGFLLSPTTNEGSGGAAPSGSQNVPSSANDADDPMEPEPSSSDNDFDMHSPALEPIDDLSSNEPGEDPLPSRPPPVKHVLTVAERRRATRSRALHARSRISAIIACIKNDMEQWVLDRSNTAPGRPRQQEAVKRAVSYAKKLDAATSYAKDPVTLKAQRVGQKVLQRFTAMLQEHPEIVYQEVYDTSQYLQYVTGVVC